MKMKAAVLLNVGTVYHYTASQPNPKDHDLNNYTLLKRALKSRRDFIYFCLAG